MENCALKTLLILVRHLLIKIIFFTFVLLGMAASAKSKSIYDSLDYSFSIGIGSTLRHTNKINIELPDYSYSATLSAYYQSQGKKIWQKNSHYPKYGISLHYIDYLEPSLGTAFGFTPEIVLPIIHSEYFTLSSSMGYGLGWVMKPHSRDNLRNNALGSHLNNFSTVMLDAQFNLDRLKRSKLGIKLKFLHVSNAAFKTPNLGLNDISAHIVYTYNPSGVLSRPSKESSKLEGKRWWAASEKQVKYIHAWTQKYPAFGPIYRMSGIQLTWNQPYSTFKFWQLGYHFEYNSGVYSFLKALELYPGEEKKHSFQQSVFLGHEFRWGNLGFVTQLGIYLQNHYLNSQFLYQKLGTQYYIYQSKEFWIKSIYVAAILKTHLSVAEFAELGIGFYF